MKAEQHDEVIECPECSTINNAIVLETVPFWSYVHYCINCNYCIMESEWKEIKIN